MASTGLQDFTGYTEVDTSGTLTVTANKATAENVPRDSDVYIYEDFTTDFFDDVTLVFEIQIDSTSVKAGSSNPAGGIALTNVVDDVQGFGTTDLSVLIDKTRASKHEVFLIRGAGVAFASFTGEPDTTYYCVLTRPAGTDTATLKIYANEGHSILLDTLTVSGYGTVKWRYLFGFVGWNNGQVGVEFDGFTANLKAFNITAGYIAEFPTDPITRVTNLIHRYNRTAGVYDLECALGEVTSDFGLPQWLSEPQPSVIKRTADREAIPAGVPTLSISGAPPGIGPTVERGITISPIQVTPVGADRDAIAHSQALAGMQDPARLVPRGDTARFGGPDPGFIASVLNVSRFRPAEELVEGLRPDIRRRGPQVPGRIGTTRQGQQTRLPVSFNPADITGGDFGNLGE